MSEVTEKKSDISGDAVGVKYCTCCGLPKEKRRVGRPKKIIGDVEEVKKIDKKPIGRPKKFTDVEERERHRKEYQRKYHEKRQNEKNDIKDIKYKDDAKNIDLSLLTL